MATIATPSAWRVLCYQRADHSGRPYEYFIRAATREQAVRVAKVISGRRYTVAFPYDPGKDPVLRAAGYVQSLPEKGSGALDKRLREAYRSLGIPSGSAMDDESTIVDAIVNLLHLAQLHELSTPEQILTTAYGHLFAELQIPEAEDSTPWRCPSCGERVCSPPEQGT